VRRAPALVLCVLAAVLLAAGCQYTVVTRKPTPPQPGPRVHTGRAAIFPQVRDLRSWPRSDNGRPIANLRLFAPQITRRLRKALVARGLFTALDPPPAAGEHSRPRLLLTIRDFRLRRVGTNAYIVPHLLLDGALLPLYAGTVIATGGQVDLGGYLIPSTKMATVLQATAAWQVPPLTRPVLTRSYLLTLPLGAVSQRQLWQEMGDYHTYGVAVGRREGLKALDALAETMSRDPHWAFLPDYLRLARAEDAWQRWRAARRAKAKAKAPARPAAPAAGLQAVGEPAAPVAPPAPRPAAAPKPRPSARPPAADFPRLVAAVEGLLDLLGPLAFTPDEVAILRDGYLTPEKRAAIVNDLRAQRFLLAGPEALPADERLDAAKAEALYDSPALSRSLVQAGLAQRVLTLALAVLTPAPDEPKRFAALRARLTEALAARFRRCPRLQLMLLDQADRAVGAQWPPVRLLLTKVDSRLTRAYLSRRQG